jgi:tRNA A37 threonylcarbamoyladenosine dehydratase
MSRRLIARSVDLGRLVKDGYTVEITSHLLVHYVPYVTANREIKYATLAAALDVAGDRTAPPGTHVAMWTGEYPCNRDGAPIEALRHGESAEKVGPNLQARFSFSNKPASGYPDFYEKMTSYIRVISHPARSLDPSVTAQPYVTAIEQEESVFRYLDTTSSRAGIVKVTDKLRGLKIGIIGLGGTGSYVLDLVAKSPVAEIRLFDDDVLLNHNAFRAPGAPSLEELTATPTKVAHFAKLYSNMHLQVIPHPTRVEANTLSMLDGLDFVFVCIDSGPARALIAKHLEQMGKAFVDVGLGVVLVEETAQMIGTVRVTTSTPKLRDHVHNRGRMPFADSPEGDVYSKNIQIAELNSLNAVMAVIKWKKLFGLYQDLEDEHFCTYVTNTNTMSSEEPATPP